MRSLLHAFAALFVLCTCLANDAVAKGKGGGGKGGGGGKPSVARGPKNGGPSGGWERPAGKPQKSAQPLDQRAKRQKDLTAPDAGTVANKKEKQLQLFQQQRDKKLAQAEHLREIAERNGNTNLAANADRMEAQALQQYADKAAHLEEFGVTDPALDPTLDPVQDPLLEP